LRNKGTWHHRPGLEGRRLGAAGRRVAADAGIGLHDLELDESFGSLDRDGVAVDEQDLDLGVLLEKLARLADLSGPARSDRRYPGP